MHRVTVSMHVGSTQIVVGFAQKRPPSTSPWVSAGASRSSIGSSAPSSRCSSGVIFPPLWFVARSGLVHDDLVRAHTALGLRVTARREVAERDPVARLGNARRRDASHLSARHVLLSRRGCLEILDDVFRRLLVALVSGQGTPHSPLVRRITSATVGSTWPRRTGYDHPNFPRHPPYDSLLGPGSSSNSGIAERSGHSSSAARSARPRCP